MDTHITSFSVKASSCRQMGHSKRSGKGVINSRGRNYRSLGRDKNLLKSKGGKVIMEQFFAVFKNVVNVLE